MKQPLLSAAEICAELAHTQALFADIRAKFTGLGVERGGHERPGVVPIYVKKYGEYISILYPDVQRFSVESSFSEAQLRYVNAAQLALWAGGSPYRPVVFLAPAAPNPPALRKHYASGALLPDMCRQSVQLSKLAPPAGSESRLYIL
ncbi:MAG: hypothetical protein H0T53_11090 [Herpetosiphonaceae bacterium]|nr:hypothetical protein [Herpetosiphonaceae bacterium]